MQSIFEKRKTEYEQSAQIFKKQDQQWSFYRIIFFVLLAVLVVYFANQREAIFLGITLVIGFFVFGLMIKKHQKIGFTYKNFKFLAQINSEELQRLEGKFSAFPDGKIFEEELHPYTSDLDIFGKNSVFQFINRTSTISGSRKLANWLKKSVTKIDIEKRQEKTAELAKNIVFLQNFQSAGRHFKQNETQILALKNWISSENAFKIPVYLPILLSAISIFAIICFFVFDLPHLVYFIPLAINMFFLKQNFAKISDLLTQMQSFLPEIQAVAKLIELIETQKFENLDLQKLQSQFTRSQACTAIKNLAFYLQMIEYRQNAYFYIFFNSLTLWDLQFSLRLEKWKNAHQNDIDFWFESVAEFDALQSLAGFAFANPDFCVPIISSQTFDYQATKLGHPLIRASKRTVNDLSLSNTGICMLITGSNMSGKSTFLRTVALNGVLALAGAMVCAASFRVSQVQIFTSMRTQDSLSEQVSSFYAELKRIRQLLDRLENKENVFYFLDEILKGTNSTDRNLGAKAIIRQLHKSAVSGLLSTHDLELGELANDHYFVQNYSFNSEIVDGKLLFDYRLTKGVCKTFNASQLMRQIGIEM